ncbi:hypothetical protein BASA62_008331 [Batrachochytrium salamandrivorans]|nr:hypothetical protein BASA62_008331 [Batrachochytrium salamandrivorans]
MDQHLADTVLLSSDMTISDRVPLELPPSHTQQRPTLCPERPQLPSFPTQWPNSLSIHQQTTEMSRLEESNPLFMQLLQQQQQKPLPPSQSNQRRQSTIGPNDHNHESFDRDSTQLDLPSDHSLWMPQTTNHYHQDDHKQMEPKDFNSHPPWFMLLSGIYYSAARADPLQWPVP